MKDIIIVGGGLAGLTAGMYAQRGGMDTLLFEKMFTGGQASTTNMIENYPGFDDPISGPDFAMKIENHARKFGLEIQYDEIVDLELEGKIKKVKTENKEYECKALILAMGAEPKKLGLDKEDEFRGRGVSYCATCDGAFYRGKDVVVVGGGDTAAEDAMFLSQYVNKVYLVHRRDTLRATKILADRVIANKKIEKIWDSAVEAILGDDQVTGIRVVNLKTGEKREIKVDGMFIAIGVRPNSELIKGRVKMSEAGYVLTNESMQTNIPGVFAAGDLRHKPLLQLVTAAADGAIAAYSAQRYIIEEFDE
ncbi:MAG TPA: thioredoxin-disulfide reductase [Clostridiales bacterium]|nr:thioredoxin-disulfide reductase [Clostridiales bacterium]